MRLDIALVNEMLIDYILTPSDSVFKIGPLAKRRGLSEDQWMALSPWLIANCQLENSESTRYYSNRYYTEDERKISMFLLKFT